MTLKMAASSNPSTLQICDAIRKLSLEETRDLAFQMGVPVKDIDDITERYSGEMQKVHLVQTWLDMVPDASWAKLVAGVRKINNNSLATEIESQYISRGPVLSSDPSSVLSTTRLPVSAEQSTSVSVAPVTPPPPVLPPIPPPNDTDHIFQQRVAEAEDSIEHLQEEFSDLKSDARESLSERESQDPKFVRKFRDHLLDLPVTKKQVHVRFFSRNEDDILKAETIQKLFLILGRYCNYTNYEIIFHVVKRFCHLLKGRMTGYRDSLVAFEKSTTVDVYLCAISARPSSKVSEGFIRMTMKISKPPSECSLYDIRELKESIEENASLESYAMYIDSPGEGSVLVVLHVHKEVCRMVVMVLTPDFRDKHLLTKVTVGGNDLTTLDDELRSASGRGDIEAVTSLIASGADVNYIWNSVSAMMWAAIKGLTEVVSLLLAAGAEIDLQNWHGYTSLMFAADKGKTEVVSLLLEAGANIDLQNEGGQSALMFATKDGRTKVVSQLIEGGANTDLRNMLGEPALVLAIRKGWTQIILLLIKAGANIDIQDKRGDSPLMVAVWQGRTEVVSLLLEAGANTDLQNERGDSAVILATVKYHLSVLKELVRAGADLNLQNQEMLTALMISSRSARTDLTQTLLSGPNICLDIQSTTNGWSALFFAANEGDVATTELLLKAGADPHLIDHNGLTALYFATAGVHKDVYELLKRHMRSPSVSWQSRVSQGIKDLAKGGRQAAKQAFIRLETRVLRPDKTKQLESGVRVGQEEEEGGVRRKPKPHPQEHSTRDEYWSSLAPQ